MRYWTKSKSRIILFKRSKQRSKQWNLSSVVHVPIIHDRVVIYRCTFASVYAFKYVKCMNIGVSVPAHRCMQGY